VHGLPPPPAIEQSIIKQVYRFDFYPTGWL
jgi:hypothetical protein